MSEIIANGGSAAYAVLGLGALGVVITLALTGMAATRRRVPLALYLLVPMLVGIVGALGAWSNAGAMLTSAAQVADESATLARAGLWQSVQIELLARWVMSLLFVCSVWSAGVGATLVPGPAQETRYTPFAAALAIGVAGLGAVVGAVYAGLNGLGSGAWGVLGILVVGGAGMAFASVRRAIYEHAFRVAGMRFAAAVSFVLAVIYAGRALVLGNHISVFAPGGLLDTPDLAYAVAAYDVVAAPVSVFAWMTVIFAFVAAGLALYAELGDVAARFTVIDVAGCCLLILALGAAGLLEAMGTSDLESVASQGPALAMHELLRTDLPSSVLSIDRKAYDVAPSPGGYGDVIRMADGAWVRQFAFNGTTWDDLGDEPEKLETITLNARPPLVAVAGSEEAKRLVEVLEKSADKKVLLLLRAKDLKSEAYAVPPELLYQQVAFLPIQLNTERDVTKELWMVPAVREAFYGPSLWFGEGMDKDPVAYMDAIFEETKAEGLTMSVPERGRMNELVANCLAVEMSLAEAELPAPPRPVEVDPEAADKLQLDAERKWLDFKPTGKWCAVTLEPETTFLAEGREKFDLPNPENIRMAVKVTGPVPDAALIEDQLRRELGALGYCVTKLKEQDPNFGGRMELDVVINATGKVDTTYLSERGKLQDTRMAGCAAQRFRRVISEPLPEGPAPKEGEKAEPVTATAEVSLDIR